MKTTTAKALTTRPTPSRMLMAVSASQAESFYAPACACPLCWKTSAAPCSLLALPCMFMHSCASAPCTVMTHRAASGHMG
jgi:hypothetical protein